VALIYRFAQGGGTSWANPQPAPSWTGFYLGGGLGAGAGSTKTELPEIPLTIDGVGVLGILPAALVGANLRVADRWVVGVEGEAAPGVSTTDFELGWLGAVRGRWGYLITPANMIYGTAGWVTTTVKTTSLVSGAIVIPSQRVNALQLGAGVESAVTPNWLVRFDYQYAIADKLDRITVDFGGIPTTAQAHPRWHYGKVAVVYLFGNN
jgi:outer membrane immunogenic protein